MVIGRNFSVKSYYNKLREANAEKPSRSFEI